MEILLDMGPLLKELETKVAKIEISRKKIETQINERIKEIATEAGEIVGSVEELKCLRHPRAKFEQTRTLNGCQKETRVFACKECLEESKKEKNEKMAILQIFITSEAYECPNCGIVKGRYGERYHKFDKDETHFHCRICGLAIGFH